MSLKHRPESIRVGLFSNVPMRLEGLASIFEQPTRNGKAPMLAVKGSLEGLLYLKPLEFLVIDMVSASAAPEILSAIRNARPGLKFVVLGPEGNDELVLEFLQAGVRAFLYRNCDPDSVRKAIEVVSSGSMWAPRRLMAKLVDRLLKAPESSQAGAPPHLTTREKQVLELILAARSNREIAEELGIEERTVKSHVGQLKRKTGADNRIELSMCALHRPLLPHTHSRKSSRPQRNASLVTTKQY